MRTLIALLCIAGALCLTGVAHSQQGYGYGQSQRGQVQTKSPFAGVLKAADELSETLETSGEEWAEVIELLDEQYGDYAEDYSFEEEVEISEDELPEIEETFGLDAETLDGLYIAAVEVDWRFETIGGELDFLHAFIETGSFPEEREDTNAQILKYVEQLRAQIDQTSEQWQNILADFDRAVEGRKPQVDQGGNPLPTQGQRRRSDISGLRAQGSSDAPSASITRSELETGGWDLTKVKGSATPAKKGKASSKKKHANARSTTAGLDAEEYEISYSIIVWAGLFIERELALLNESVVEFTDAVDDAQQEEE